MKTAVVKMSDIAAAGRMDAGFHIMASHNKAKVDALRAKMSEDEARNLATELPREILAFRENGRQILAPLARTGNADNLSHAQLIRVAMEYPYLTLVALGGHINAAVTAAQAEIDEVKLRIASLKTISDTIA